MKSISNLLRIAHYNLFFYIEIECSTFNVKGTLTIKNDSNKDFCEIPILLYHQLKVKNIKDENNRNLCFSQESLPLADEENYYVNYIAVNLNNTLKQKDQINLYIEYEGSINGYSDIMFYVQDKINKEFSIIRPDCHAYPMITEACNESILKSFSNSFTYNLFIDVPKDYVVGCGGVLEEIIHADKRKIFKYIVSLPTWRFDIAIAQYSIVEDKNINLKIFVFPEHRANAEDIIKNEIKRAINFFANVLGNYPEDKYFTVIETKEGYGSQAGDSYIMMEEHGFIDDSKSLTHLYHEIGHAWNVKAKYSVQRTRFFDEAFACYFEALAIKEFFGDKAYKEKMELYRINFIKSVEIEKINYDTPICDYGKFEMGHNSYTKGPWVLYVLNEILGDEKFHKTIRNFLNKFKHEEVDFKDFEEIVQEGSSVDLKKFFSQWIYGVESSKFLYEGVSISDIIESIQ